jgi:hypothetical protein
VAWITTGDSAFGSTCRQMMLAPLAPAARAASMYSRERIDSVEARIRRTQAGTTPRPTAITTLTMPTPSTATRARASRNPGNDNSTSITRWMTRSSQPP